MLRLGQIPDEQKNHRHHWLLVRGTGGRSLCKAELQMLQGPSRVSKVHYSGFANTQKQEQKQPGKEGQF